MIKIIKVFCNLLIVNTIIHFTGANMDFIYSPSDLYHLVQTEQKLAKLIDQVEEQVSLFSTQLKRHGTSRMDNYDPDEIIKNPILAYHLVKRHARELQTFDKLYKDFISKTSELEETYSKIRNSFIHPVEQDINKAMEAIVRIRQTYGFNVNDISEGRFGHLKVDGKLSSKDLADIGVFAAKSKMLQNSKLFLSTAVEKYKPSHEDPDDIWFQVANLTLERLTNDVSFARRADREDYKLLTELDELFAFGTDTMDNLNTRFEEMCQLYSVKEPPVSHLKCYLDKFSSPVRLVSPYKIEVFHEDPQVVVIYDFISDSEIEAFQSNSFHRLKRSVVQVLVGDKIETEESIVRTTSQAWIRDLGHPEFGYLAKRIQDATGYYLLGRFSAEETQIASYRPGGHYSLHTDALHEKIFKKLPELEIYEGDRVATFMLYLTDVEMGGNTAFPMLNVSVRPTKGSAILWGNLYPDGSINRFTLHGACPVVYGVKNIATKWIKSNDQMFTRQNCKKNKKNDHYNLRD